MQSVVALVTSYSSPQTLVSEGMVLAPFFVEMIQSKSQQVRDRAETEPRS